MRLVALVWAGVLVALLERQHRAELRRRWGLDRSSRASWLSGRR